MARRVHRAYLVVFLVGVGIAYLILGNLTGRLVGAASLLLAAFLLRMTYLRQRARRRAKAMGECPWCRGAISAQATVCPHCQEEITPLHAQG
jgi:Flp pilus assembly protein TadB